MLIYIQVWIGKHNKTNGEFVGALNEASSNSQNRNTNIFWKIKITFFLGQNGYGDYQEQPQLVYQQFSDQDYNLQQYPDYPLQNEQFNQYGPG